MSHLRTFTCTPNEDVVREAVTFTGGTQFDSPGLIHIFNRGQRPSYKFELKLGPLTRQEVESLSAFHAFHMGGKSFLWNGDVYGEVRNYSLISEGDTSRRDFFIPNRYIGASSVAVRTVNQATGATSNWAASSSNSWPYSLNANPGILSFANSTNTIPASGHDLQAIWGCQYRCVFEPSGIRISNFTQGLYQADLTLWEVVIW